MGLFLPWWSIAIAAFIIMVIIVQKPSAAFLSSFISVFIFWGGMSYWISIKNNNLLAHKISMLVLRIDTPLMLIIITGIIGGLIAGFAGLTGSYLRSRRKLK